MRIPTSQQLTEEITTLTQQLSNQTIAKRSNTLKEFARLLADKRQLLELVVRCEQLTHERQELEEILASEEEELKNLANEDLPRIERELAVITQRIEALLLPYDPLDTRDAILEIRAGTGGEEAALFASELFRAYSRYAETHGWALHVVSGSPSEQSGFKEVIAEIAGDNVFGALKYERGVHRVQRVPFTERQGRIHTSTITVAVLPQAEEVDIAIKPEDLRIDTYRASGAGGQHVNKTSSAVRITHLPTGTVVAVQDERSQHKNREKALRVLRARLLAAQEEERHTKEAAERRAQIGTGERSEKIRTYNFPQDRVTDHRIKKSWGNLQAIMDGRMDEIFQTLREAYRQATLDNSKRTAQN